MKIAGTRDDGALLLDLGLACHILKGDAISAPTDRATLTAMGPWFPRITPPDVRRQIERRIEIAHLRPLHFFTLVTPHREDPGYQPTPPPTKPAPPKTDAEKRAAERAKQRAAKKAKRDAARAAAEARRPTPDWRKTYNPRNTGPKLPTPKVATS